MGAPAGEGDNAIPPARCAVAGRAGSHPGPAAAAGRQISTASATTSAAIVLARCGCVPGTNVARRPRLRREVGDVEANTAATLLGRRIAIKRVRGLWDVRATATGHHLVDAHA